MKYAAASLVIPGLGQILGGRRGRGLTILGTLLLMIGLILWTKAAGWWAAAGAVWLWNVWDAYRPNQPPRAIFPVVIALVMFFAIGWRTTEIDFGLLARNFERALIIIRPMFRPDFVEPRTRNLEVWVQMMIPCAAENNPVATHEMEGASLTVTPDCASIGEQMTVVGKNFWPDSPAQLIWQSPIGDFLPMRDAVTNENLTVTTDSQGNFNTTITVPRAVPPGIDPNMPQEQRLYLRQSEPIGGVRLSTNGSFVVRGIYETITLALVATTLGTIFAIPISFFAARNLMSTNAITLAIYVIVRTILNIVRSIESLIIAIIFVVIVGLGPFAGMLALAVHTVAALGKLYSEMIEGIDPGPLEAIRAVGGNWFQVVRYAVVPQIIPPFTAFTIYRWDINVRASTIIGFVGGGGIGFFLVQWINLGDFRAVSASFIAILVVVMVMDFFSARIRARLTE